MAFIKRSASTQAMRLPIDTMPSLVSLVGHFVALSINTGADYTIVALYHQLSLLPGATVLGQFTGGFTDRSSARYTVVWSLC